MVAAAVLLAALLHASWNAIACAVTDRLVGFALLGPAETTCPLVALVALAFRTGAGPAEPAVPGGGNVAAQRLHAASDADVSPRRVRAGVPAGARDLALAAAVATGVLIAGYRVVDGVGVRHSGTALGYTTWLFLLQGPVLPVVALLVRRGRLIENARGVWTPGLLAGVLSVAAYGLVLWAQTVGTLATVAGLRESSIVFGAVFATVFFKEPFGRARIVASAGVVAGIALLTF